MNKERAINILIAHTVCCDSTGLLSCEKHCPFDDDSKDGLSFIDSPCVQDIGNEELIVEAVKYLVNNK